MNVTYDIPKVTIKLVAESCAACSTHFAIDERLDAELRESGKTFYCPIGHSLSFGESEIQRLRKEAQALKARAETAAKDAEYSRDRLQTEKYQHAATKGKMTKFKNRVAAGVCPCCNRTFQNLNRHMEGQHPEFKEDKGLAKE